MSSVYLMTVALPAGLFQLATALFAGGAGILLGIASLILCRLFARPAPPCSVALPPASANPGRPNPAKSQGISLRKGLDDMKKIHIALLIGGILCAASLVLGGVALALTGFDFYRTVSTMTYQQKTAAYEPSLLDSIDIAAEDLKGHGIPFCGWTGPPLLLGIGGGYRVARRGKRRPRFRPFGRRKLGWTILSAGFGAAFRATAMSSRFRSRQTGRGIWP